MQLHDNAFSPYAFKVRAVLYEKRAEFTKCEIERAADRESLLRLNPRGEVPVLVDGDAVLCDSKVICAYLEERFPEPELIPKEPVLRARCRYLELKSDTELDACVFVLAILKLTRPDALAASPEALTRATELLSRLYGVWERELAGRDWLLGAFSLVDIALAPHVRAAAFLGHPPGPEHPALSAWLTRVKQRPSLRQATLNHSSPPTSLIGVHQKLTKQQGENVTAFGLVAGRYPYGYHLEGPRRALPMSRPAIRTFIRRLKRVT